MTWTWFSKRTATEVNTTNSIGRRYLFDGVTYKASLSIGHVNEWWHNPSGFGPNAEAIAYLAQLEEEGLATQKDGDLFLTWNDVFTCKRIPQYAEGFELLQLPPEKKIVPVLSSTGALEDPTFAITISNWLGTSGKPLGSEIEFTGAVARIGEEEALVSEPVWRLTRAVAEFYQLPQEAKTGAVNRKAWSVIRRYALDAEAILSDFLQRTVVLTPERLKLGMRKVQYGDTKMIEVQPSFESAPDRWLHFFDHSGEVLDRYDIPDGMGMFQVLIDPKVKTVLREIKRWPGRRVAGVRAEAFIRNPFAALGDDASDVIDEDEFEKSRTDAGIVFQRFATQITRDHADYPRSAGLSIEESIQGSVQCETYTFPDAPTLERFVRLLESRINAGMQCCGWEGYELEILGDTPEQLALLKAVLADWKKPHVLVRYSDVHDLSRYSERVDGIGVEKPYFSPFITKKKDEDGWFPENVAFGIWFTPEGDSESVAIALSDPQLDSFQKRLQEAEQQGKESFEFPGFAKPISRADAQNIIDIISDAKKDIKDGKFTVDKPDTATGGPRARKTLLLKANIQTVGYQETRKEVLTVGPSVRPTLPKSLKPSMQLKDHQMQGVAWLQHLWNNCPQFSRGALLADDMGLGKTVQLLTFIAHCLEDNSDLDPTLIVAPVSLLENWKEEIDKFFTPGALPVLTLYGETLRNKKLPRDQIESSLLDDGITRFLVPNWIDGAKVVLTTYETLRDLEFSLAAQKWSIMVCDEAQKIKNPNALVTRATKKQNVKFRIACTGTPVENTLVDLWCLYDYVQPGLLGALNDFGNRYRKPIEAETNEEKARVAELRSLIEPQLLRRTKKNVAKDLKQKIPVEECRALQISSEQRKLYSHAINLFRKRSGNEDTPLKNHLGLLQYLRRICTDPQPIGCRSNLAEPVEDCVKKSPKLAWLLKTLESIRDKGEKAIVFVEFRDLQRLIQKCISERFGFSPDIVNGTTTVSATSDVSRQKRIKVFQEKPGFGVIILSPLAAGFGLNIQAANHVFHYTRSWNPAKEDQATDRAYRIGQEKDVYVYYMVVKADDFSTFDVKLDALLEQKRALSDDMLNGCGDLRPSDFGDLGGPGGESAFDDTPLTVNGVVVMDADSFESFCAAMWSKQGYPVVYRTPKSGDGGVDVVAIRGNEGVLAQCKSSLSDGAKLSWEAIKDVVTGEALYRLKHPGVAFKKYAVTNQFFNDGAIGHARLNNVELVNQLDIAKQLQKTAVTRLEVEKYLFSEWGVS